MSINDLYNQQLAMQNATAAQNTNAIWYYALGTGGAQNANQAMSQKADPTPYSEPMPAYKNPKLLLTRKA